MASRTKPKKPLGELYMEVRDHKKFASVVLVQGTPQRELAEAAGWSSHTYLGRLLRGEAKTLSDEAALRIAHKLGMPVDMLFLTVVSEKTGQSVQTKSHAGKRKQQSAA
ncbi:helix-turn-helix transcriptional regulator [Mycobacterium sp. DL99]|uniref:helix-turn-helix domain-containing protein n=1 Tax=Mycobacterium sp. DL99 TaxID=2528957 RepID=UPI0010812AC1|nr:helix-turn-helix transcriptional regulator [Mycobacterium sp. DL99]